MKPYPKRNSHFAHRAFRIMHKSCAAAEMGRDAFCIVATVLHTEDAARYTGPVTFWNSQLMETLGFSKWDTFDRARGRAVDAGWLVYHQEGRRQPGRYYVTIPARFEGLSDAPLEDVSIPCSIPPYGDNAGDKAGINEGIKRGQSGVQSGDKQGEPPTLSLKPNPSPIPGPKRESAGADSPPSPQAAAGSGELFACVGGEWELPAAKLEAYREAFPGVDLVAEFRKVRIWLDDHPPKRPRAGRGAQQFLSRWLGKAHEAARRTASTGDAGPKTKFIGPPSPEVKARLDAAFARNGVPQK